MTAPFGRLSDIKTRSRSYHFSFFMLHAAHFTVVSSAVTDADISDG